MDATIKEELTQMENDGVVPSHEMFNSVSNEFVYIWTWMRMLSNQVDSFEATDELAHEILNVLRFGGGHSTIFADQIINTSVELERD